MKFNDTTNKSGVIQACERYTGLGDGYISGDSAKLFEFTQHANHSLRKVWHTIFMSTGCWEYDDSNQSDLPQAITNLLDTQSRYALPTGALTVKRVEAKDSGDNWYKLKPLIRNDIGEAIEEFNENDGLPRYYRLIGDTIEIFPASNYNKTGGLKVYFDRGSVEFASTDTTKETGIAGEYEDLIPLYASLQWLSINLAGDQRTAQIKEMFYTKLEELKQYYNRRFPAKKKRITRAYKSYK